MANKIALIIIFVVGCTLIMAAIFNWKVFFENKKFGGLKDDNNNKRARILYVIIGLLVIIMGIFAIYNGFLEDIYE